ncbi:hypothetical protein EMCRGX_G007516 [Ephydatia muelleri]|eukprot:Em0002g969a
MQGVLPLKPLSNQKSSQTVVDMFTDDGLLVGQVAKKGSTRRQVSVLSSWMEAWNILHSDRAQTALELVKYQHIICQLFAPNGSSLQFQAGSPPHQQALLHVPWSEPPTGAGSQAVVENTLPRPGHVLHQWPCDLHELTPLYDQQAHTTMSSHHSTISDLTPLYDQRAHTILRLATHTTLRPASSHHSTTSELTPLYKQRAHTTLRPVKLTPLYDQQAHTTLRPEFTSLYDQRAHTTLRPANSHHSTTSDLTPLYNQRAHTTLQPASSHHSATSELAPLYDQRTHTSTTSELTPLYDQWNSHHSTTSELTPLYDQ